MQVQRIKPRTFHRDANQTPAEFGHKIDIGRFRQGAGHDKVAFVLAILIVHNDDHSAAA
jgi:hypothetical protein